ncbi:hypothetical protein [Novispirillum itersonii]|uniref:hypothetical protein n=1 Tax=Novispirillum itersonii TaxID=189 RepID=UPI00037B4892|nr:hypothetical protein [Novispirillum itersonii]
MTPVFKRAPHGPVAEGVRAVDSTPGRRAVLTVTLWGIAAIQAVLGLAFLLAPAQAAALLGLSPAPGWADWLFGMMAARCLGFAYGMGLAARNPAAARSWIGAMVGVQALDWLVTLRFLLAGAVTLAQVSTASFLPVVFVVVLLLCWPQRQPDGRGT